MLKLQGSHFGMFVHERVVVECLSRLLRYLYSVTSLSLSVHLVQIVAKDDIGALVTVIDQ